MNTVGVTEPRQRSFALQSMPVKIEQAAASWL